MNLKNKRKFIIKDIYVYSENYRRDHRKLLYMSEMYRSLRNFSNNTNIDIFKNSMMKFRESYHVDYSGKHKLINILSRGNNPRIRNKQRLTKSYLWALSKSDCRILPVITDNSMHNPERYKLHARLHYMVGNGTMQNAIYVIKQLKRKKGE